MKELTFDTVERGLDEQILRTLLYYDIFNYPLTADEVYRFLGMHCADVSSVIAALTRLADRKVIFQFRNFFSVKDSAAFVERRVKGNEVAEKFLDLAGKKAALISKFPFVRAVLASGSLSKGYMDEKSDLDFFIITSPGRLWIARTLLVLYKRIFLLNSHKYFCVNYFVDEQHLEIEEKNLFTATELATVLPLYGSQHYTRLHDSNPWLWEYFPNFTPRSLVNVLDGAAFGMKSSCEKLLNIFFGNAIEKFCRRITLSRWKREYQKHYSTTDFNIAFKSKSYASKNHPSNFQRTIMEAYELKLRSFGLSHKGVSDGGTFLIPRADVLIQSNTGA